jgi:colicin import membrane protein
MRERSSDRWISVVLSVLLHAGVVGVLAFGWWTYQKRPPPPAPSLAIEATVVDSRAVGSPPRQPEPPPPEPVSEPEPEPPPEPEPEPEPEPQPPQPSPEEIAARERLEEEARLEEQRQAEARAREEAERRAEAERREAEARRIAEEKRREEAKRLAEEKRKAEEARLLAQREAELRRSLEAEERVRTAQASGLQANWVAQITARIQRAWIRPPSARAGLDCTVYVSQVPGGEVVNVRVGACNGDQAVRDSIEAAVYRASPLPPPPDPALFERNLEIRFIPTE